MSARAIECPRCGAPAPRGTKRCVHCAAALATRRCGACLSLELASARHCSGCGSVLADLDERAIERACPRCRVALVIEAGSRAIVARCVECDGVWLDHASFDAIRREPEAAGPGLGPRGERATVPDVISRGATYVPCPACARLMNRRNFARVSGVIVDVCKDHGVWLDAGEFQAILDFVARGGLDRAEAREEADRNEAARREAVAKLAASTSMPPSSKAQTGAELAGGVLGALLAALFD